MLCARVLAVLPAVALFALPFPHAAGNAVPARGVETDERRNDELIETRLADWWKAYRNGSRAWELFRDDEIEPQGRGGGRGGRGGRQRSPLAQAIRSWQSDGQGWGRGRRRGGAFREEGSTTSPEAIARRIGAIREAAASEQEHLREKVENYCKILELFQEGVLSGSPGAITLLLEPASLEESLSPQVRRRLDNLRPELIQREAVRALRRAEAPLLADGLMAALDGKDLGGDKQRVVFEILSTLVGEKLSDPVRLDRIAQIAIVVVQRSKFDPGRIAAAVTLRNLSRSVDTFRLPEAVRDGLLEYLEKSIARAPEDLALTVLKVLADHPDHDSIGRLVQLAARSRSFSERLRDELWATLTSITPASISVEQGGDAWVAWWEAEQNEPRLAAWLKDNQRGVKPQKDPNYAEAYFYGIPIVGKSVVFVIDVSGSMREPMRGTDQRPKIEGAKEELSRSLEALLDVSTFTIVTFAEQTTVWSRKRVKAEDGRKRALEFVARLAPDGGTNLHQGLISAFGVERLERRSAITGVDRPDQIILLSDGNPTVGVTNTDAILSDVDRLDPAALTRIDTIAFGPDADRRFLQTLAERHGGILVDVR